MTITPLFVQRKKILSPDSVSVLKHVHPATKDKWYTPVVGNTRMLKLSFKTSSIAYRYGQAVLVRYGRKYKLMEAQNGNRSDA